MYKNPTKKLYAVYDRSMTSLTTEYRAMKKDTMTNREKFLEKLRAHLSAAELDDVQDAYVFAKYAHRGQLRSPGGRYFEHPRAVAEILIDELEIYSREVIITALLHDVIEDTWLLNDRIVQKCFGKTVAEYLRYLTRNKDGSKEEFREYIEKIARHGDWRLIVIKLCDRLHNLRTANGMEVQRRRRYVEETERHFYSLIEFLKSRCPSVCCLEYAKRLEAEIRKEITKLKAGLQSQNRRVEK